MIIRSTFLALGLITLPLLSVPSNPSTPQDVVAPVAQAETPRLPGAITTEAPTAIGFPLARWASPNRKTDDAIRKAAAAYRSAETSSEKSAAEQDLAKLLSKDYDARLKSYEDYLNKLEEKLKTMREKLDRRRLAKADMVKLRIQVLEAEAGDLGWPSRVSPSGFPGSGIFDSGR